MTYLFLQALVPLFIIVNPLGAVPLFLTITAGHDRAKRQRQALMAGCMAGAVLVAAALLGREILAVFSVSIDAFRIAGGIILFSLGFEMLEVRRPRMKSSDEEVNEAIDREYVGVTPMGIPMLAGPGAITTTLVLAGQMRTDELGLPLLLIAILLVGISCYVILGLAVRLQDTLGPVVLGVIGRLEGLLLATIAVQMFLDGVTHALPALVGEG